MAPVVNRADTQVHLQQSSADGDFVRTWQKKKERKQDDKFGKKQDGKNFGKKRESTPSLLFLKHMSCFKKFSWQVFEK